MPGIPPDLAKAAPAANVVPAERDQWFNDALAWVNALAPDVDRLAGERAAHLRESHRRVRQLTKEGRLTVQPQLPVDLLGV